MVFAKYTHVSHAVLPHKVAVGKAYQHLRAKLPSPPSNCKCLALSSRCSLFADKQINQKGRKHSRLWRMVSRVEASRLAQYASSAPHALNAALSASPEQMAPSVVREESGGHAGRPENPLVGDDQFPCSKRLSIAGYRGPKRGTSRTAGDCSQHC